MRILELGLGLDMLIKYSQRQIVSSKMSAKMIRAKQLIPKRPFLRVGIKMSFLKSWYQSVLYKLENTIETVGSETKPPKLHRRFHLTSQN